MASVSVTSASGRSLLFVCPAHSRVEIARVCFSQFADLVTVLRARGMKADCVVIADDGNLEAADQAGLLTIEHDNRLGAKLNAGYSFAAEHGYEYVCAVGNDSWLHPDRFLWMPATDALLCTRNYTCVTADAGDQHWLKLDYDGGTGSRVIPLHWLSRCDYKPLEPGQSSGCDTGTLLAICRGVERAPHLIYTDLHPYEVVGFQSSVQITDWQHFTRRYLHERKQPFHGLADHYPAGLVDDIRAYYAVQPVTA